MTRADLVIRNARDIDGQALSVVARDGLVAAWGDGAGWTGPELDGRGGLLLPGFHDHHLHLLASAARMASVDLTGLVTEDAVIAALRGADKGQPPDRWLRAVGYDERAAGLPDADRLTHWMADRPLRLQDRTGALWILNRAGLDRLGPAPFPPGVERGTDGAPTGRIWREDGWLRDRLGGQVPDLAPLGSAMLWAGITGVSDAGAGNGAAEAALLSAAGLPQRLTLMGKADLAPGEGYRLGPVKIAYDERDLPPVEHVADRIRTARQIGRSVAAHCVTLAELVVYLAALDQAGGAQAGDRIEHGGIIPAGLIPEIAERRLTIVTQPCFIHDRGDRYRTAIDPAEMDDLYRLGSLRAGGIAVAAGSDAPYGSLAPLDGVRAAMARRTREGALLGAYERLGLRAALGLYLGTPDDPGRPRWRLHQGEPADLCLLSGAGEGRQVAATLIGGQVLHHPG